MTQDFTEKLRGMIPYCDRFERITLFELTQYFGQSLFLALIWLCTLPLFFFSAQWIVLPLSALIIMSSIWYFFDVCLWLPDTLKAKTVPASSVKNTAGYILGQIDRWNELVGPQGKYAPFWVVLGPLSVACIAIGAFVTGFASSASYLPVFSLFLLAPALLLMDFYLASIGCLFLLLEGFRVW